MTEHAVIIGCGFSGALQAINLLRHQGPRATLIERRAQAGKGLAFGAAHPTHLLNVRAANMSAFPDDPGHFARWLTARGVADAAESFVPRLTYGDYLSEQLDAAQRRSNGRLTIVHGDVEDVVHDGDVRIRMADGGDMRADVAVLAVGNLPPHHPPGLDGASLAAHGYFGDPWDEAAYRDLRDDETILIIGTGLTMVDVALRLDLEGFRGRILAVSRRGLSPKVHAPTRLPDVPLGERPQGEISSLVRQIRRRADAIGWRAAVDELRPMTQDMWRAASDAQRDRFLRHARPWWDVHRHRIAPDVAARLQRMVDDSRLEIAGGRPFAYTPDGGRIEVSWRRRGSTTPEALRADRIINCTGPQGDLLRATDPLLATLVERGTIRPDPLRLGIDVDAQARTVDAEGNPNDWLLALGPMTRGSCWEIVAVPDIRIQTWSVARRLSNAHWVEGEGL
ncbi:FAD-dependent oxidoreductase [Sphingomonas parva]|uniref:FAD-dependent oxidoreductase n=1 Tax=Sphingomonas parva TaxID=2555898 RepID=A0A4Y8ZL02_9SPHN|nr:FAD/NAD(P)-binding protein [Sphingomonas parva]TFI56683.1 FAD-dependent oxidoreductase [Sphingomonas parva]